MLNPRPKNALVSPRVHNGNGVDAGGRIYRWIGGLGDVGGHGEVLSGGGGGECVQRGYDGGGVGDPAEDAALCLDHFQADALEFREIRTNAIGYDEALVTAVVGLTRGGVHAHLGGDAGDQQLGDPACGEDVLQFGGIERALAGLVDDDLAVDRRELVDDVVAVLAADQDAAVFALVPNAFRRGTAAEFGRRAVGQVGLDGLRGCGSP